MRWSPNPYAIAERLTGHVLGIADGEKADAFLRDAFLNEKVRAQLERLEISTIDDAFNLFRKIASLNDEPLTLEKAREFPLVRAASEAYGANVVENLLPFLLPISDAEFDHAQVSAPAPNAVGVRVDAAYVDTGPLVVRDVLYLDPKQGLVGDCYLIAAMIALAWTVPDVLAAGLQSSGYRPPQESHFDWLFHEEDQRRAATVTGRVPSENGLPIYAKSEPGGEFWPSLIEKAYVQRVKTLRREAAHGEPTPADYQAIGEYEKPWRACRRLAGGEVDFELHNTDLDGAVLSRPGFTNAAGKVTLPLMAMTLSEIDGPEVTWQASGLHVNHAYAVLGKLPESGHIVLRDPLGHPTTRREQYLENHAWDCGERDPVEINKAGVFAIAPALFNRCFKWAGWVNL